jgi:soluble lytic murein transglycosylase-like protein
MRAIRVLLVILALAGCSRHSGPPATAASPPPTRAEIWAAIQKPAMRYRIDPAFVYALVAAESNFDPSALNGGARGLLQLKPAAWKAVSTAPYDPTVWDWQANLEAGIDYLAYARSYLHQKTEFSYPLLLASFHYGLEYVEEHRFDVGRIPVPDNPIYRRLWAGNLEPVPPPSP